MGKHCPRTLRHAWMFVSLFMFFIIWMETQSHPKAKTKKLVKEFAKVTTLRSTQVNIESITEVKTMYRYNSTHIRVDYSMTSLNDSHQFTEIVANETSQANSSIYRPSMGYSSVAYTARRTAMSNASGVKQEPLLSVSNINMLPTFDVDGQIASLPLPDEEAKILAQKAAERKGEYIFDGHIYEEAGVKTVGLYFKYTHRYTDRCTIRRISKKHVPHCGEVLLGRVLPLLIVGAQRSGTHYSWEMLNRLGIDVHHEGVGRDGAVGWPFAINTATYTPGVPIWKFGDMDYIVNRRQPMKDQSFRAVFHQVRHPLRVITTIVNRGGAWDQYWAWVAHAHGFKSIQSTSTPLRRAMLLYILWNKHIERYADLRFQSETTSSRDLCRWANFDASLCSHVAKGPSEQNVVEPIGVQYLSANRSQPHINRPELLNNGSRRLTQTMPHYFNHGLTRPANYPPNDAVQGHTGTMSAGKQIGQALSGGKTLAQPSQFELQQRYRSARQQNQVYHLQQLQHQFQTQQQQQPQQQQHPPQLQIQLRQPVNDIRQRWQQPQVYRPDRHIQPQQQFSLQQQQYQQQSRLGPYLNRQQQAFLSPQKGDAHQAGKVANPIQEHDLQHLRNPMEHRPGREQPIDRQTPRQVVHSHALPLRQSRIRISWQDLDNESLYLANELRVMCLEYGFNLDPNMVPQANETAVFSAR